MHICFLTHEYPKEGYPHGGVGTFVRTLGRDLVKEGIKVSVIGTNYIDANEDENDSGVMVYRLAPKYFKGLTWYLNSKRINQKLAELHLKEPIDVVETAELGLAFITKRNGIKYIIRLHGGHHFFAESENRNINPWRAYQEKRSFRKADKIIGVSNYVLDQTAKYLKFNTKRGSAIYNPIDLRRFYCADPQKAIKGRILFVGTICEKKGVRQLIMALPKIRKEVPEAHLLIAGRDWKFPDGSSYVTYVKGYINERDKESITFLGPIENDQIPGLIESSEVCVYPSHMEAMPLAWLEVMAMGKAFVASNTGPGPEIIQDCMTGLLCNPMNPQDIADKTIMVLKDYDLRLKLGLEARKDIEERFAIDKIVKQNILFYKGIIEE
jgi:glycosyltransferase involved in cell wall biosynthesis